MRIHGDVLGGVFDHARTQWPRECCGILLADAGDHGVVRRALPARNADPDCPEQGYVVDPETHVAAIELERAGEARVVGYYHSHPHGGAIPSRRDAELAAEHASYLIVGLQGGGCEAATWRWAGTSFVLEPLDVVGPAEAGMQEARQ